jgi:hypothetical protein
MRLEKGVSRHVDKARFDELLSMELWITFVLLRRGRSCGRAQATRPSSEYVNHNALPRLAATQNAVAAQDCYVLAGFEPSKGAGGHPRLIKSMECVPDADKVERCSGRIELLSIADTPQDVCCLETSRLSLSSLDHLGLKVDSPNISEMARESQG